LKNIGDSSRYEYKYKLDKSIIPDIRKSIQKFTKLDTYLKKKGGSRYTVRSIYFDTADLDFYYEKKDGVKIRKKLRVRTYNDTGDYAFLEIKRKFINCIAKERSRLPFVTIERLISTTENSTYEFIPDDHNARLVSGKFLYNLLKKGLVPTMLIVYEREAYIGILDQKERITIDTNVKALANPDLGDILNNQNLKETTSDFGILEAKFDNIMPRWIKNLTRDFNIKRESISKYCLGVEATCDLFANGESV
jgi:SPX domain protein involved in polyphosphate accumulation